jgi:hypothetical protein
MQYGRIMGMYSHKNNHARIYDSRRQVREPVKIKDGGVVYRISPDLIYDKFVTYRTYQRNLKRIIKETK